MCTDIDRISTLAKEDPQRQFFSIAHLLTVEELYVAFRGLRWEASAGIDGVTYEEYEKADLENLHKLHQRLVDGTYQAQPLRRVYIPKENGKQRPISIPALEDKIVQKAVVELLNAVYEQDFLPCSYGFRPKRSPHQALTEVGRVLCTQPMEWVLEIDIVSYFTRINHQWLRKMVAHRIADPVILSLIGKWLKAGAMQDGVVIYAEEGTP
jgi:RNA-directed DNA polymerase